MMLLITAGVVGCDDRELVPLDSGLHDAAMHDAGDSGMDATVSPSDQLQGLWEGACITDGSDVDGGNEADGGVAESTRQGFAFSGDQLVSRIERYFDPSCQTPIVRLEITGTFSVGDPVADNAHELDIAISALTAQLLDPDFEDLANAESFLGFTDWDADVARDVLGVDVFGNNAPIEADAVVYQIFRLDRVLINDVELPVLYLGNETGNGPTVVESQRPTTLSNAPHAYAGPVQN